MFNRGDHSVIETFPGMPLDNDYSMNVADICPVGALTTKDFRFKIRVWFLDDVPGVCTGCSNGCNVHLGVANNKVYRYVPRRNDAVNETWICDAGPAVLQARSAPPTASSTPLVRSAHGGRVDRAYEAALETAAARSARADRDEGRRRVIAGSRRRTRPTKTSSSAARFLDALGTEHGRRGGGARPRRRAADQGREGRERRGRARARLRATRAPCSTACAAAASTA